MENLLQLSAHRSEWTQDRENWGWDTKCFFLDLETFWQWSGTQHCIQNTHTISHCLLSWAKLKQSLNTIFMAYSNTRHMLSIMAWLQGLLYRYKWQFTCLLSCVLQFFIEGHVLWKKITIMWISVIISLHACIVYWHSCKHLQLHTLLQKLLTISSLWGSSSCPLPWSFLHAGHVTCCYPHLKKWGGTFFLPL